MTIARDLLRARTVCVLAWRLSLEIAAGGWRAEYEIAIDGLALSWRDCGAPWGWS